MAEKIVTIITAKDKGASRTFKNVGGSAIALNQSFELLAKATKLIVAPMVAVIDEGRKFGAQMSAVQAVTKATAADMKILTDEARRLGATTAFTATQSSKAMEELGRAGQSTAEIIKTTGQALNLAAANSVELADSASLMAIQMNIFKSEGIKAERVADLINQTISSSPQNFEEFRYAMQFAAGTASAFNRSFAETTQIIGALAESGVRGSKAGTALNMAFARLAKPTAEGQKIFEKYGITLDSINPATNKFADIIDILNDKNVTQIELFSILGQVAAPKFFKLIGKGGDAIRDFAEKQKGANTALEAARVRLNNLDGDIILFNSAMSGLKLTIYESLDRILRSIVKGSTAMVLAFDTFISNNQGTLTAVFEGIYTAMDAVWFITVKLINAFGHFLVVIGTVMQTKEFGTVMENWFEIFVLVKDIVVLLYGHLQTLGNYIAGPYINVLLEVYKVMLKVGAVIQDILILGLKALKYNIQILPGVIDKTVTKFNNFMQSIKDMVTWVKNLITSFKELAGSSIMKVINGYKKFVTESDKAVLSMLGMDEVLVGNTLVPGFNQFAKELVNTGNKMINFTGKTKAANKQMEALDKSVKNISDTISGMSSGSISISSGFGKIGSSILSALKAGGALLSEELKKAFDDPIGTLSSIGSTMYSFLDSFVSTIMDLFMSNEKFAAAMTGITDAIGSVLAPIIEAFIPILTAVSNGIKKLAPSFQKISTKLAPVIEKIVGLTTKLMDELGPILEEFTGALFDFIGKVVKAVAPIIKTVSSKVVPMMTEFINQVGPSLIKIIEAIGPLIEAILNVIGPILEELNPLVAELNKLIAEILPVITAIFEVIAELMPIIRFIIQFLVNYTRFMMAQFTPILKLIVGVLHVIVDILKVLVDVIMALINGIGEAVGNLYTLITGAFDDLGGGISNLLGGFGGGGDSGPDILDPRTWGFAQGTGSLTKDQLLHLPGMESNAGLIKAHVGESVGQANNNNPMQLTFNISAIDPRATSDELRRLIEELRVVGKI